LKKYLYYVYYVWLINININGCYGWLIIGKNLYYVWLNIEKKISTMSTMSGYILKKISLLCLLCLVNKNKNKWLLFLANYWKKNLYYVSYVWLNIEKNISTMSTMSGYILKKYLYYVYYVWLINRKINGYYGWLIIEKKSILCLAKYFKKVLYYVYYVWFINIKINGYYGWLIIEKKPSTMSG
jgi:hypothetical protein